MRESDLLEHIYRRSADLHGRGMVLVGPGDDCAVIRTGEGEMLITVDQLVEGRHFAAAPAPPIDAIARKAVARSVSDIAAMGGTPVWGLATGVLPPDFPAPDALFDDMARWARHWDAPLIGGDIAAGCPGSCLVLTVTIAGVPHPARGPVLRSGARPGDDLWVTGTLGGSLHSGRHMTFEPRIREGLELCARLGPDLHAMIDLSDGLGRDAARLARASGVRIDIVAEALPRHPGVADWRNAAADGEDYELCFAAAPGAVAAASVAGTPVTRIGRVVAGSGCVLVLPDGSAVDAEAMGWDHGAP